MTFIWETEIDISEEEARDWHFMNSDDEADDDYVPEYDDYYGAAREAFENDDCEYDLVDVKD